MNRRKLQQERDRRVASAEAAAGIREGHYNLDGQFVRVWISFYPKQQWRICDCDRHNRGQDIPDTARTLDDATKARLERWL